jgi:hypothetical protein
MPSRLAGPTLLAIGALMIGGLGCWSSSSSTRVAGTGGAGWSAAGRSGGLAGPGGVAGSAGGTGAGGVADGAGSTGLAGAGSAGLAGAGGGGSAGRAGAGGVAGSDGSGGGAGAGNSVGAGAGGVAGIGGGAGSLGADGGVLVDAAVNCDDLHNRYAAKLLVARRCTVDASDQCTQLVASSFPEVICGPSGGQTYVNDAGALAPDLSEVLALHCTIAIKCGGGGSSYSAMPDGGVCVATDGGSGLCAFLSPYTTYP